MSATTSIATITAASTIDQEDVAASFGTVAEIPRSEEPSVRNPEATPANFPVMRRPAFGARIVLATLATVTIVFALQWAQKFFIPLVLSILISYTLTPVVACLERLRIPRILATSMVLLTLLGGAGVITNSLHNEFQAIMVELPDAAHRIAKLLSKSQDGRPGTMEQMQAAATEIEKAANQETSVHTGSKQAPAPMVIARPAFKIQDWLWVGSKGAAEFAGQVTMVLFLVFFLLLSGDSFKRKLVKITGPSLSSKKITVNILDDINTSIQSYMFMLLVTNMLLALGMWIAFRWIGLENAGAWAVAAGLLHIIPYFGPLIIALATGIAAFMQFGTLSDVVLVSGASLAIATLVGTFITTWATGKIAKMNTAAIFIGLLFWGWLWGIWGLLLGVPIIVMVRVVSEHIDGMQSIAELLSE